MLIVEAGTTANKNTQNAGEVLSGGSARAVLRIRGSQIATHKPTAAKTPSNPDNTQSVRATKWRMALLMGMVT